jgi:hypothetical protein
MSIPAWLHDPTLWLCLLAGAVGAIWALSEIIGEFRTETWRALRTWGAWMLMAVNFIAATLIYLLAAGLAPAARTWPTALAVGFAWPTVFRNASLKLTQPLNEAKDSEAAAIRLEQVYGNIQKLSLQLINSVLTRQRARLLTDTLRFDRADLEKYARRMIAMSLQQTDDEKLDRALDRSTDDDAKKAYLAAFVMNTFTRSALDDFIKEQKNKGISS